MSLVLCCKPGCRSYASPRRDDGLCWRCRKAEAKRIKRLGYNAPRPVYNDGGTCEMCGNTTKHELRGGKCGPCRIASINAERAAKATADARSRTPCSVMKCKLPAELGGRTCLEHRPLFERVMVARRPNAEDFATRHESLFDYAQGEG